MYVACSGSDSGPKSVFSDTGDIINVACCNTYYTRWPRSRQNEKKGKFLFYFCICFND